MDANANGDQRTGALAKLAKVRAKMAWSLSVLLLILLAGSTYLMSFGADIAAMPISNASNINVGIAYSSAITVISACVTATYAFWANRVLDPLIKQATMDRESSIESTDLGLKG